MHRLDQRAFAHAARAPQQRIVGGQPVGETARVGEQGVALIFDRLEQRRAMLATWATGDQPAQVRLPDKGVAFFGQRCRAGPAGASRSSAAAIRARAASSPTRPFGALFHP